MSALAAMSSAGGAVSELMASVLNLNLNRPPYDNVYKQQQLSTRSSAIAEGLHDASCQLKSCQLPCNSAETTYTTSPDQIDGMKLDI